MGQDLSTSFITTIIMIIIIIIENASFLKEKVSPLFYGAS